MYSPAKDSRGQADLRVPPPLRALDLVEPDAVLDPFLDPVLAPFLDPFLEPDLALGLDFAVPVLASPRLFLAASTLARNALSRSDAAGASSSGSWATISLPSTLASMISCT